MTHILTLIASAATLAAFLATSGPGSAAPISRNHPGQASAVTKAQTDSAALALQQEGTGGVPRNFPRQHEHEDDALAQP